MKVGINPKWFRIAASILVLGTAGTQLLRAQETPVTIRIPDDATPSPGKGDPDQFYAAGNDAFNRGDYIGAETSFTRALAAKPAFSDAHFNRGLCFAELKDWRVAAADFSSVIVKKPKMYDAYVERARCYVMLDIYTAADADLATAQKLAPHRAGVNEVRGEAALRTGRFAVAVEQLTAYIRSADEDGFDQTAYKYRGTAYFRQGRWTEAVSDLSCYTNENATDRDARALLDEAVKKSR